MDIDRSLFKEVSRLKLATPGVATGSQAGDRRSPFVGRGVEFADYRPYSPGDDLRLVDWNVYKRLQTVLVRLFHEDRNLMVAVAIDASESMSFGTPRKIDHAGHLALAVSLISLRNRDRVTLGCAGGNLPLKVLKGQNQNAFARMLKYLKKIEPDGIDNPVTTIKALVRGARPDRLFFISDMLKEEADMDRLLRVISASARRPVLLHVLGDEELAPDLRHPARITDSESGDELRVLGGRSAQRAYQKALTHYLDDLEGRCRALRIHYIRAFTEISVSTLLNSVMRSARIVQSASGATR